MNKSLMFLFMFSMVLLFAGCTSSSTKENGNIVSAKSSEPLILRGYLEDIPFKNDTDKNRNGSNVYYEDTRSGCLYKVHYDEYNNRKTTAEPVIDEWGKVVGCRYSQSTSIKDYFRGY